VSPRRAWTIAWLGGSALGVANGALRELAYENRVGDRAAHQLSAVSLGALLGGYFALLQRRWPIPTRREALEIGATWAALTAAFDFGFGHYVDRKPWQELLDDYDLRRGQVWPLLLAWIAAGPTVARELSGRRSAG
jgi:hypothetical protein